MAFRFSTINDLTREIIGAAIEVHRSLGLGLLESAYEECLSRELDIRELRYKRQYPVPLNYKGVKLEKVYQLDLLIEDTVLVEVKSVEAINPIYKAQTLTYMRLGDWKVGLLFNFNVEVLREGGICRLVLNLKENEKSVRLTSALPLCPLRLCGELLQMSAKTLTIRPQATVSLFEQLVQIVR